MKDIVKNITNYVILLSVVVLLIGIVLVAYPGMSLIALGNIVGAILIVYSVINIVYMIVIKKNAKDVEKIIAEKENDINVEAE
jgi:uncharacterized membrane protein HdeD (DUF308 family)